MTERLIRIGRAARLAAGLAAVALVPACSGPDAAGPLSNVVRSARALTPFAGEPAGSRINMSDAKLLAYPKDLMLVEIPAKQSSAGLVRQVANGGAVTWVTPDGVTVTLRDGQVIGTAGLGNDLASAEVPDIRRAGATTLRDLYHVSGTEDVVRSRYICDLGDGGAATVTVAGASYPTRLRIERCRGADGRRFENRYWVQSDGLVRKSRQWISEGTGYLIVSDVHGGRRR